MDLAGKAALVTGGRRIGISVATRLAGLGVDVGLSYKRSREEAALAAEHVRRAGRSATVAQADLTRPAEVERLVDATAAGFGRLDILINMASVYRRAPFDALTDNDWTETLDVDLSAAWRLAERRYRTCGRRAAGGSSISVTGPRPAADPATPAIFPITWPSEP